MRSNAFAVARFSAESLLSVYFQYVLSSSRLLHSSVHVHSELHSHQVQLLLIPLPRKPSTLLRHLEMPTKSPQLNKPWQLLRKNLPLLATQRDSLELELSFSPSLCWFQLVPPVSFISDTSATRKTHLRFQNCQLLTIVWLHSRFCMWFKHSGLDKMLQELSTFSGWESNITS